MYKQGDIVAVRYPFSDDFKKSKLRPAIVVSNDKSNSIDNDIIICQITSKPRNDYFSFALSSQKLLLPLPKNSEIRCNKIITIRKELIIGKYTEVKGKEVLDKILKKVKGALS